MGFLAKLRVLLWKNFILRKRNKFRLVLEVLYPLLMFIILASVRPGTIKRQTPECHYTERAMPSAGQYPFLHSFLCRADTLCINRNDSSPVLSSEANLNRDNADLAVDRMPVCDAVQRERLQSSQPPAGSRGPALSRFVLVEPTEHTPDVCEQVAEEIRSMGRWSYDLRWDVTLTFIKGTILFYPDTAATRDVMSLVNDTFNTLTTFPAPKRTGQPLEDLKELLQSEAGQKFTKAAADAHPNGIFAKIQKGAETFTEDEVAEMKRISEDYSAFVEKFEQCVNRQKVRAVSPEDALAQAWLLKKSNELWALVHLDTAEEGKLSPSVKYSIRMDSSKLPAQQGDTQKYISSGFSYLQDMIDSAILQIHTGRPEGNGPGRILQQLPQGVRETDPFLNAIAEIMPLMMVLAWVYPFSQMVKCVVLEKEERVKEVLAVMGLGRVVQWFGWLVEGLSSAVPTAIVLCIVLKAGSILGNSDITVLLLLLISFLVSMFSFALFVSSFFSTASIAGPASGVIYFLSFLTYQIVQLGSASQTLFASVLCNVALAQGTLAVAALEQSGEGAQWSNVNVRADPTQPTTLAACIGMMWLDAALYAILAWYIDAVFPGKYGVPKPVLFFLDKAYWFGPSSLDDGLLGMASDAPDAELHVEAEPENAVVGVAIEKLTKTFGGKAAVNGLTLNFYQDQINCFLGHNGAGKTTTISMLTGLYPPTSGTARLYGKDIREHMDLIRASMGYCPQHNILFNNLTVEEHLLFFGWIKGVPTKILKKDIDNMLSEMGLEDKRTARTNTLSGGMKRKLSVGIAFVGGSQVVFLDEPTAGVDPFSRRAIWELLVRFRQGRTIILTTHFMDEADLLGDRIAIVSEGRLQCCGSSLFLKERLGSGYHLTVEWAQPSGPGAGARDSHAERQAANARKALLLQEVLVLIPGARLQPDEGDNAAAAVYILPDRHDVAALTALLERLDECRDALGIASYAMSDTALEEIFLKVAEKKPEDGESNLGVLVDDGSSCQSVRPLLGQPLVKQQFVALTKKRFHYVRRDIKGLFTQLVLPACFVTLALALASNPSTNLTVNHGGGSEVQFGPDLLGEPLVTFFDQVSEAEGTTAWGGRYFDSMLKYGLWSSPTGKGEQIRVTRSDADFTCSSSPPLSGGSSEGILYRLGGGELLYNATGVDVEAWVTNTFLNCQRNRNGGVSFGVSYDNLREDPSRRYNSKIWFSSNFVSQPVYMNAISNVILRASVPTNSDAQKYSIISSSLALPPDPDQEKKDQDVIQISVSLSSALTVIFAMSFVPATFVMFLVEERINQSKHLQLVSGLRPYVYWLQCYSWDLMSFAVSELLVILIFVAYQTPMYVSGSNIVALIILIYLYGMSCTPLLYLTSWVFRIPSMAFLVLSTANLLIGMASTITIMVLKITDPAGAETADNVLLILPQYCLGQGLMNMVINFIQNQARELQGIDPVSSLSWDITGKYMVAMAAVALVLVLAVFTFEQSTHWWHGWQQGGADKTGHGPCHGSSRSSPQEGEDDDVQRERQRVADGHADQGMLVLKRITKRYSKNGRPAVDDVSLGVERGQCFGLLGLNGAGKTSIFKMLTGDALISGGDALVAGHSVRADMDRVRRLTGYCPQFDALLPPLTVWEHLDLYSSLRGVPAGQRASVVRQTLQMMDLASQQFKQSKALSGGNKRKLSVAIAMVGEPSLLYMDEPTTSMDPVARRFLWQRVRRVVASGQSVLLTSHSMEECEALCGRLTIMVNGHLTCIGSPQHLKHKYGSGYLGVVRCDPHRVAEARALLLRSLPGAVVVEAHVHQMKLQMAAGQPLVQIFRALDEAQRTGCVTDYSVTQTTLEDVFMRFARAQKNESP